MSFVGCWAGSKPTISSVNWWGSFLVLVVVSLPICMCTACTLWDIVHSWDGLHETIQDIIGTCLPWSHYFCQEQESLHIINCCLSTCQCDLHTYAHTSFSCTGQRGELPRLDTASSRLYHQVVELLAVGFCQHLLPAGSLVSPGVQHALPQGRRSIIHGDLCTQDRPCLHHI